MPSASGTDNGAAASTRPAAGPSSPAETDTATDTDAVLAAERAHLRASREFLRLMRENVLSLRTLAGDPISEEYLKADLYRRAEALNDLPDTPLFFGRLDYSDQLTPADTTTDAADPAGQPGSQPDRAAGPSGIGSAFPGEQFHIGRRHVHDPDGHPVVIDWRGAGARPGSPGPPRAPAGPVGPRR